MGTRADFFIGHGLTAEYLGSVPWDGCRWAEQRPNALADTVSEAGCREAVANELREADDGATLPEQGWPWPWKTTATTDFTYVFEAGAVHIYNFGAPYPVPEETEYEDWPKRTDWRDMTDIQKVTYGKRSGMIVVGLPNGIES